MAMTFAQATILNRVDELSTFVTQIHGVPASLCSSDHGLRDVCALGLQSS